MLSLERNSLITICPNFDKVPEDVKRYRWGMHVSLPYPFPSRKCVNRDIEIERTHYSFSIHNHLDRVFIASTTNPGMPQVFLHDPSTELNLPDGHVVNREVLQSVAVFRETTDYSSPNDAFQGASVKITKCMDYLTDFLQRCQVAAPYLVSWLVYPIALFDVGTVFHDVQSFCPHKNQWQAFASAAAISTARRVQHPMFFLELPDERSGDDRESLLIQASNELLAEAGLSQFRGMMRLTVLNSYAAVESLANAVFTKLKTALLIANNVPQSMAHTLVEEERQRHKTEPAYLYHRWPNEACNRSLLDENKQMYDDLIGLQHTRHAVAHSGHKPSPVEARAGHKLACECVQWLAGVAGLTVKPLFPREENQVHGIELMASDAHAISTAEHEFLCWAMGIASPPG